MMYVSNMEYGIINDRIPYNKCVFLRGLSRSQKVAATGRCAGACVSMCVCEQQLPDFVALLLLLI